MSHNWLLLVGVLLFITVDRGNKLKPLLFPLCSSTEPASQPSSESLLLLSCPPAMHASEEEGKVKRFWVCISMCWAPTDSFSRCWLNTPYLLGFLLGCSAWTDGICTLLNAVLSRGDTGLQLHCFLKWNMNNYGRSFLFEWMDHSLEPQRKESIWWGHTDLWSFTVLRKKKRPRTTYSQARHWILFEIISKSPL